MNDIKAPMTSKTIQVNTGAFAVYTLARWIWPDVEIPEDVVVQGMALINILLRMVTTSKLGK